LNLALLRQLGLLLQARSAMQRCVPVLLQRLLPMVLPVLLLGLLLRLLLLRLLLLRLLLLLLLLLLLRPRQDCSAMQPHTPALLQRLLPMVLRVLLLRVLLRLLQLLWLRLLLLLRVLLVLLVPLLQRWWSVLAVTAARPTAARGVGSGSPTDCPRMPPSYCPVTAPAAAIAERMVDAAEAVRPLPQIE